MIITCPACKAQAQIPDSKEGAKVRCGECDRVYKATGGGRRAATSNGPDLTRYFIIGGAVLVLVVLGMMIKNAGDKGEPNVPPATAGDVGTPKEEAPKGWEAPAVKAAVELHRLAAENNKLMLRAKLHGGQLLEKNPLKEGQTAKDFKIITSTQQEAVLNAAVDDIMAADLVAQWVPIDGWLVPIESWSEDMPENTVVVRLSVRPADIESGIDNRHVEWHLIKKGVSIRAYGWQRWISPEEEAKAKAKKTRVFKEKTLSDGSQVIEGVIREIEYMEETPGELRDQIESLIDVLQDPDGRPAGAMRELADIGKPAIPGLLTRMSKIPLDSTENLTVLNLISRTLTDITDHQTTLKLQLMGGTEERQDSGVKQWFGWYDRKFKRFTTRVESEEEGQ